jgi:1,4-dihydroxy-2-naphthoate polyprenyltransferase
VSASREIWTRKLIYPGHTFPTAAAPALVACGLAWHDRLFAAGPAALALLAGWLIQFAGVVTDNYENLIHQPEDGEHPELVRAVQTGLISLSMLKTTIVASYGLALLAGFLLVVVGGWPVVVIGLASIAASWAYSAGPWPIGPHGLADPLFFFFFGIVSVAGTYYVQAAATLGSAAWPRALSLNAVALGLPIGALAASILIIDDIRDREFDVVKGKRTIAVRFGARWSRVEFVGLLVAAYALPFWFWRGLDLGPAALLPLVTLPFAALVTRQVWTRERFADLVPMTPRAAQLLLAYAALLAAGVALSRP